MANSSNAYASAVPVQGNISEWISNQENQDMRLRQEKQKQEEFEFQKKSKEEKDYFDFLEKFKDPEIDPTGVKSVDEMLTKVILQGSEEAGAIRQQIKQGMSVSEKSKLLSQQLQIDQLPKKLKLAQQSTVKQIEEMKTQEAEGKIVLSAQQKEKFDRIANGEYNIAFDKSFNPLLVFENEGGKPTVIPYNQIMGGLTFGDIAKNIDWDTYVAAKSKRLLAETGGPGKGFTNRKTKAVSLADAQKEAESSIGNVGSLGEIAISAFTKAGIDPKEATEQQVKDLKVKLAEDLLLAEGRSDVTTKNFSAEQAALNRRDRLNENTVSANPITYVQTNGKNSSFVIKTPYIYQNKNKNNPPGTIDRIEMDDKGNITLTGQIFDKKVSTNNYDNRGNRISTDTEDRYKTVKISDPDEVAVILSGVTDKNSYSEIQEVLQSQIPQQQQRQQSTDGLPDFDGLPDL